MNSVLSDILTPTVLPFPVIVARLTAALLLGAIIGFERELRERPAGLRTHSMVALAACAFAVLTIEITGSELFSQDSIQIDPTRVIEAVTAGVAFLGAGIIVLSRGRIRGVTTAAGVWLGAAIGLSLGFGYWTIGFIATLLGVIILMVMRRMEQAMDLKD